MHNQSIILASDITHKSVRIILGLDNQLTQIRRFCDISRSESTVFGIDRTFGLSSLYATTTVFKQMDILRTRTQDHPIMLGPILLSSDATEETYTYFLNQLKLLLKYKTPNGVMFNDECFVLGSDQERALINAMQSAFPDATRFVCVYHISKNIQEKLRHLPVSD